jgi:predicted RNase H-like HicB family nuclease
MKVRELIASWNRTDGFRCARKAIGSFHHPLRGHGHCFGIDVRAGTLHQRLETGRPQIGVRPMRYMVVIEEGADSFGAYVPDLSGCIAAAETREEVLRLIREAIEFHLEGLRDEGASLPQLHSFSEFVEVRA